LAVLVAIAIAVGAGDLSHPAPRTLSGSDVESQLALGIQAQRGGAQLPRVRCPTSEPVEAGHSFSCMLDAAGAPVVLNVVEVDGRGRLRWTLASPSVRAQATPGT
jgi:Domain of unknown function (DUF4333)